MAASDGILLRIANALERIAKALEDQNMPTATFDGELQICAGE